MLALYQLYNHKIKLTAKLTSLGYLLLRSHMLKELEAMKKYITDNLGCRFIKLSKALFAALILFV